MTAYQQRLLIVIILCSIFCFARAKAVDQPATASVHFSNGDVTLVGTRFDPTGSSPHPGVVLIGGSGSARRGNLQAYAEHLCSLGFCALTYDKRGNGESTGDWTTASLDDLTDDAAAAVAYLRKVPGVDGKKVGVWGVSQAGWIIPKLTAPGSTADPAFAIILTGGGATPREVEMTSYELALDRANVTGQDRRDAEDLLARYFGWLKDGIDRAGLLASIQQARSKSWYAAISLDQILPSDRFRPKWEWVATFDPLPLIKKMRIPVLVLLGGKDRLLPVDLSAQRWKEGLASAGNTNSVVKIIPDANHAGRLGEMHSPDSPISPEYFQAVKDFLVTKAFLSKSSGSQ